MHSLRLPEAIPDIFSNIPDFFVAMSFLAMACVLVCGAHFLTCAACAESKMVELYFSLDNYDKYHISPHCHEPQFFCIISKSRQTPIISRRTGKRVCLVPSMSGVRIIKKMLSY